MCSYTCVCIYIYISKNKDLVVTILFSSISENLGAKKMN